MKTRITELLGIEYPIIQAAMAWITDANLVTAISEAGGMGTLGPNAGAKTLTKDVYETAERLRAQIRKVRELTDKPFAVNFPIGFGPGKKFSDRCIEVGIEERLPVAIVSEGSPEVYTRKLKEVGIKVLHVIHTKEHARRAEEAGVDAVITSGTEGGGHSGWEQLTTFATVPIIADAVKIPVIVGGGVADGRGLIAAQALGGEGVYMGTRFIATKECPAHPKVKEAIIKATELDTVSLAHGPGHYLTRGLRPESAGEEVEVKYSEEYRVEEVLRGSVRMLMSDFARQLLEMEVRGSSPAEMLTFFNASVSGPRGEMMSRPLVSCLYGGVEKHGVGAGQEVGLISNIPTCLELIQRMIQEAELVLKRIQ